MIGQLIKGKYKIYDTVGSGGFATVYLGRNLSTNEIVAIKVLAHQFTAEPQYIERFQREAMMAQRLQHPNIVQVLDYGIENGTHFLVMEYVEGLTLGQMMEQQGRLSLEATLSYAQQICAGLQAAYEMGIVHRDIKPANVMITPAGTVKIMDFGIARMESMSALTQSGAFMGTPRYIAPEIARGADVDIRADLYATGLLTYEMLAGVPPFDANTPWAVLRMQMESQPTPIRQKCRQHCRSRAPNPPRHPVPYPLSPLLNLRWLRHGGQSGGRLLFQSWLWQP
jgi:serine/threonine protein kinase